MPFDLEKHLRRVRAALQSPVVTARKQADLVTIDDLPDAGGPILLDTCAILDGLQGKAPRRLLDLTQLRDVHHSSLVLAELFFAFGRLDPSHAQTAQALASIRDVLEAVPTHRVITPDEADWVEGTIRAGVLNRHQALPETERKKTIHDAILAAQVARHGIVLITKNRRDFDRLAQLDSRLQVAFY